MRGCSGVPCQHPTEQACAADRTAMNDYELDPSLVIHRSKPGWFQITHPTNPAIDIYVSGRVHPDTGQVVLEDVFLHSSGDIRAADLRAVPMGRIEAHLSRRHRVWWLEQPRDRHISEVLEDAVFEQKPRCPFPADIGRQSLRRPDGTDPAAFLASVAEAYRDLWPKTKSVALAIAAEADVPPATARRWIYDARRRGLLTEGGRGKG